MPGAPYSSPYLLEMVKRLVGRPNAGTPSPASWYTRLSEAQAVIVADIAAICPEVLYPTVSYDSIPQLTSTDGGQTFTFGTDSNGYALAPMGKTGIYASLNDIPDYPWVPGRDYVPLGGTAIQIPNNGTWTGPLYWRGITPPGVIDDTHAPVLFPEASRALIAYRAAIAFLEEGGRNLALAATYKVDYGRPFGAQPGMFAEWCLTWRTSYRSGGVLGPQITGMAVAVGSAYNNGGSY